jgi:outer membrane lipoprotein-sorting protein
VIRLLAAALMVLNAHAETLPEILARMDHDDKDFRSMTAKLKQVDYTAVIDESTEKSGEVRLKRTKGGSVVLVQYQQPDLETVQFDGKNARTYFPKANTVNVYEIGKLTRKIDIDEVLLVGFGTSGADLSKAYAIKVLGTENLGSIPTTRLELTPKSAELQKYVTKFELWIPDGKGTPMQEKATGLSKNYSLFVYSELVVNPPLPDSAFELKLPPGVRTIYPGK